MCVFNKECLKELTRNISCTKWGQLCLSWGLRKTFQIPPSLRTCCLSLVAPRGGPLPVGTAHSRGLAAPDPNQPHLCLSGTNPRRRPPPEHAELMRREPQTPGKEALNLPIHACPDSPGTASQLPRGEHRLGFEMVTPSSKPGKIVYFPGEGASPPHRTTTSPGLGRRHLSLAAAKVLPPRCGQGCVFTPDPRPVGSPQRPPGKPPQMLEAPLPGPL